MIYTLSTKLRRETKAGDISLRRTYRLKITLNSVSIKNLALNT